MHKNAGKSIYFSNYPNELAPGSKVGLDRPTVIIQVIKYI